MLSRYLNAFLPQIKQVETVQWETTTQNKALYNGVNPRGNIVQVLSTVLFKKSSE